MQGIRSSAKEQINRIVEDLFDKLALQFLGDLPRLRNKKFLAISYEKNLNLAHLFVQAMNNKNLNPLEEDILKGSLESAHNFIESLKNKTKANITERLDQIVKDSKINGQKAQKEEIEKALEEEFKRAKNHFKLTVESEGTKFRNMGSLMDISRIGASHGEIDPSVFFIIVRDGNTCKECIRLHMMPDKVTPKIWKLSQLKNGYHKRSEDNPSVFGLHPGDRCTLTYLSKGFGFDFKGHVKYISENHNEHEKQNKKK